MSRSKSSPDEEPLAPPNRPTAEDGEQLQPCNGSPELEDATPQRQEMQLWALYSNFQGPLPPPSMMAEYKKIGIDFPERFVAGWEAEGEHRRFLETSDQELQKRQFEVVIRAQRMAFSLAVLVFMGGFALLLFDKPGYGFSIILAEAVALAAVFLKAGKIGKSPALGGSDDETHRSRDSATPTQD